MNQPTRATTASAPWRDMTRQSYRALGSIFPGGEGGADFQKTPVFFSQKLPNVSLNFSDTNHNNQSGRFPVLQERELEQQRSYNVNKNTL